MKQRIPVWPKNKKLYPVSDEGFAAAFKEIKAKEALPHTCDLPEHTQFWNDELKTFACPECGARWEEYFEEDYGNDEGGCMAWDKISS